jgi:hypothetical protein
MLALVIPISCKLREHATFVFLKTRFQELYKDCPYSPKLGLKESWRHLYCSTISKSIDKTLDAKSEMSVQVEFTYTDDQKDYSPMWVILCVEVVESCSFILIIFVCCILISARLSFGNKQTNINWEYLAAWNWWMNRILRNYFRFRWLFQMNAFA